MQKGQIDQSLDMKKRARRRLVGAIALVLLMIIVLPMILEDRAVNQTNETVEITMPGQSDHAEVAATNGLEEVPVDMEEQAVVEETEQVVSEAEKETEVVPEPSPPKEKQTVTEVVVEASKSSKKPTETAQAPSKSTDQYHVQIGVYSKPDPSAIKKLQVKLDELGYQSFTEKMQSDGSVKTKLRTQSFDSRNEAAIALKNIDSAGLTGMVVRGK